jgi:hypothetical protein
MGDECEWRISPAYSRQNLRLKGKHDSLLGYSGKQVEIMGTTNASSASSQQGVPVVLHITRLKKLTDFCQ